MKAFITSIALASVALAAQAGLPVRAYGHLIAEQGLKLRDQSPLTGASADRPHGEGDGRAAGIGGISGEDTFPRYLATDEQGTAGDISGIGDKDSPGDPHRMHPNF
jgi:hypothetical protein